MSAIIFTIAGRDPELFAAIAKYGDRVILTDKNNGLGQVLRNALAGDGNVGGRGHRQLGSERRGLVVV